MTRSANPLGRALLVLGMHRSGTSAAARVLNLLGAELGHELVPPGPDNPGGFWEHAEAVRINDELLHGLGRTWYDMRDMPDGWVDSGRARSAVRRIGGLIERDFAASGLCVVKDPRMCLVAPLWIEAFETRGFEVDCLFVVRDPREVVASLHRRNDWPRASLYLMWVQYLMEAAAASRRGHRAMITYDQLLSDWRGGMARVARELHLCWPVVPEDTVSKSVDAFLDPAHRHHEGPPCEAGDEDTAIPDLAMTLYQACLEIAAGEDAWTAISGLHDSYRRIGRLYAAHVDHLLAQRWGAEHRAQTAEARMAEQDAVTTVVRGIVEGLQDKLDARIESLGRSLEAVAQQARAMEANVVARLEEQASATGIASGEVQRLQNEMSALSGETAARLERQREGMMVVEARIQRQQTLLNTIELRLEQAANDRMAERSATIGAASPVETQQLRSALANSDATIAALIASTSWKLTAPLRWLSVHVLRRPPAMAGLAAPKSVEPDSGAGEPSGTVLVEREAAGTDAADESAATTVRARPDRRDMRRGSVAFRWM